MVGPLAAQVLQPPALLAQLIERLPPVTKAKVLLALLGIVVLGLGMILLVVIGGRYVRRLSRSQVSPSKTQPEDWFRKPLSPPDAPSEDSEP